MTVVFPRRGPGRKRTGRIRQEPSCSDSATISPHDTFGLPSLRKMPRCPQKLPSVRGSCTPGGQAKPCRLGGALHIPPYLGTTGESEEAGQGAQVCLCLGTLVGNVGSWWHAQGHRRARLRESERTTKNTAVKQKTRAPHREHPQSKGAHEKHGAPLPQI